MRSRLLPLFVHTTKHTAAAAAAAAVTARVDAVCETVYAMQVCDGMTFPYSPRLCLHVSTAETVMTV